jgi:signal peptide peptidase SppA
MNLESLKQSIYSDLWAILPKEHKALQSSVNKVLKADTTDMELPDYPTQDTEPEPELEGDSVVIEVHGTIVKGCSPLVCALFGLCDVDALADEIREVAADDSISTVLFDFDSPGGMVLGVYEVAEMIRTLGETKRTIAFSSGLFASAAYWLGSACNEIYCSPSSIVGSVGVSCIRYDDTAANEANGLKAEFFATSPRKFWGNPDFPITDDEREWMQASIERTAAMFYSSVTEYRTIDQENLDSAAVFDGIAAVENGFADGLYNSRYDLEAEI